MKNKKLLSVILACIMLATAAAGCGQKEAEQTSSKSQATSQAATTEVAAKPERSKLVTENGTFPIVNEPVTLKVFAGQPPTIQDYKTNEFTLDYAEKTGVNIEWEVAPSNALNDKRKISLASGSYPDVYFAAMVTKEEEMMYGPGGVFIPLNDLIDEYAVAVKQCFEDFPGSRDLTTAPDGNIYSLANMSDTIHTQCSQKYWINKVWLDNLGLSVPKTTEEFYNVLKAFKEQDPNKNGKPDEIPFYNRKNEDSRFVNTLINSFIQNDKNGFYVDDNDKIQAAYITEEWREGLRWINKLVSEKLLDETSFSATMEQAKAITGSGDVLQLGAFIDQGPVQFFDMAGERHKDFICIDVLKGPKGQQNAMYDKSGNVRTGALVVTNQCKNPEVVLRWTDYFYTQEGILKMRFGEEGVAWRNAEPDEKSYTGEKAVWAKLSPIGGAQNICWAQLTASSFNHHTQQVGGEDIYSASGLETRLYQATINSCFPYIPKKYIPELYLSGDAMKKIAQPLNDIKTYVEESIVRFAIGDLSLDKDWDEYVKNIEQIGVQDILNEYQGPYEAYVANTKK